MQTKCNNCTSSFLVSRARETTSFILILHLCVRESGRSREGHSTRANNFSSSLDLDVTYSCSLTQLAMALAAT